MRKIIWTTDSKELRIMIAARSNILGWTGYETYGEIEECIVLDSHVDHMEWDFRREITSDYVYIEPELFIAECARRFPKKRTRTEKEILAEIENILAELKSVMK